MNFWLSAAGSWSHSDKRREKGRKQREEYSGKTGTKCACTPPGRSKRCHLITHCRLYQNHKKGRTIGVCLIGVKKRGLYQTNCKMKRQWGQLFFLKISSISCECFQFQSQARCCTGHIKSQTRKPNEPAGQWQVIRLNDSTEGRTQVQSQWVAGLDKLRELQFNSYLLLSTSFHDQ